VRRRLVWHRSLSLSLLFFVSEKEERDRARLFFLSFFPFFGGGKLFFSRRGNLNAKHWPLVFLSFYLFKWNSDYLFKLLVRSSSLCVFNLVGFYLLLRVFSLLCVASKTRSASGVSPGWCKRALGDLLFSLFLSLSLSIVVRSSVWSLFPQHTRTTVNRRFRRR